MPAENIITELSHRLAARILKQVKAQRQVLTYPVPVGYQRLTNSQLRAMFDDPLGQQLLQQQFGVEGVAAIARRLERKPVIREYEVEDADAD